MGLTALRNKQGIKGKPANTPGGPPSQDTMNRLYETAATKGPAAAHDMVGQIGGPQAQQAVQSISVGDGGGLAPRYQKMLADGVDPEVVRKRASEFQAGKLPGQGGVSPSGQTPGIVPGLPGQPTGRLPTAPGGGRSNGGILHQPPARPLPLIGSEPAQGGSLSPGAWGALGGGMGNPGAPLLPNGQPMGGSSPGPVGPAGGGLTATSGGGIHGGPISAPPTGPSPMVGREQPIPAPSGMAGGSPMASLPLQAFSGGGYQSGPMLPNGQPMGGGGAPAGPAPFAPREQPIPGPGPAGGGGGGGSFNFMGGNDPSQGGRPLLPNGQPMANIPQATPDPQDRQAAIARGLAGRMAGGIAQ